MAKLALLGYFQSVVEEGKKVVWPSRETVIRHTGLVIISISIATLIFASFDYGLQKLVLLSLTR